LNKLTWQMDASFGEGETASVEIDGVFTIVEVAAWPMGREAPPGSGLMRTYRVRISGAMDETAYIERKHFEIYKIPLDQDAPVPNKECMEIELASEVAKDVIDEGGSSEEDEKKIKDFKKYLHEMSDMPADEYKGVMRRLFKTWHPDKAGDTPLSQRIFRMLRSHEQWYKKKEAGETDKAWDDDEGEKGTVVVPEDGEMKALPAPELHYVPAEGGQSSWFDEFESEMRNNKKEQEHKKVEARAPEKPEFGPSGAPEDFDEEKAEAAAADPAKDEDEVAVVARDRTLEEVTSGSAPGRIVDRQQAPIWLQQARLEFLAAKKLFEVFEGYRSLPAAAVWHCEQVVEMAIKAAMLRTCGVSEDESIGGSAHDIAEFVRRLRGADAQTEEQRLAQQVPVDEADVMWLKRAYLASRYPKPGNYSVPSENYKKADAENALKLAEETLKWAANIEDLPDPGLTNKSQEDEASKTLDIRKQRWAQMLASTGDPEAKRKLEQEMMMENMKRAKAGGGKFVAPPAKAKAKTLFPEPKAPPKASGASLISSLLKSDGKAAPPSTPKVLGGHLAAMVAPKGASPAAAAASAAGEASPSASSSAAASPAAGGDASSAPAANRWKRHQSVTAAGAASPPAADAGAAAATNGASGEKRGLESRVADLKERLKQRKLQKQ